MTLVALAAAVEVGTGLILMVQPSALAWLLLGAGLSPAGEALGRIGGFALLALGWACWPKQETAGGRTAAPLPLLIYNVLITIYLAYLGIGGELAGILLWPAVALHAGLSILLVRKRFFSPTIQLSAAFVGIVVWVFGRKRKARFEKDARIPVDDGKR